MGSCASKPKYVDYDPPMRHQQKKNEEHEVKQEDDGGVSPVRRSGSRPSLGILFQKENDEQGELLTQQDEKLKIQNLSENILVSDKLENSGVCSIRSVVIEDQVSINGLQEKDKQCELLTQQDQKLKIQNPSENVPVSDKLENSGASAIQSVVHEDQVKTAASLASAKEVHEDPLNHETITASLDGSSTNEAQDVGTDPTKINDLGFPTATQAPQAAEVSDVVHVENITGVEGCMAAHESENQLMTVDTATETGDSFSSLKDDHLIENAKNSLMPGTELPVVDIADTSHTVQDNNLGTFIPTSHVDNIEKSQDSEVKLNVVNDYQKPDVEDKVFGATLPANESYVPNTTIDNTSQSGSEASPAVSDCISNAVKDNNLDVVATDRNYVAEDDSGNSLKLETMISNDVNHTSGEMEDKEACDMKPSIENHDAENFLKPGSKFPVVDNLSSFNDAADNKVGATQQGTIDNDCVNDAENALEFGKEVPNIDLKYCSNNVQDAALDVTVPVNGSGEEACNRTQNTVPVPIEDHHSNPSTLETVKDDHMKSLTLNKEEQISESIKASGSGLDAIKPIDGFKEESPSKPEDTDLVPVEYHHGNSVSTAEEQFFESKKDSVAENVDSVVPTSIHISSVVEESVLSGNQPGERSVTETVETEGLHRQVEELAVSSQSDHLATKAEAETTDVDKNANQDNECSGKTIHSFSQVHQEELTQNKHRPVLESVSEENCQASSTNLAKELAENDKVPNVENVEGASVNNTHHVTVEL